MRQILKRVWYLDGGDLHAFVELELELHEVLCRALESRARLSGATALACCETSELVKVVKAVVLIVL